MVKTTYYNMYSDIIVVNNIKIYSFYDVTKAYSFYDVTKAYYSKSNLLCLFIAYHSKYDLT